MHWPWESWIQQVNLALSSGLQIIIFVIYFVFSEWCDTCQESGKGYQTRICCGNTQKGRRNWAHRWCEFCAFFSSFNTLEWLFQFTNCHLSIAVPVTVKAGFYIFDWFSYILSLVLSHSITAGCTIGSIVITLASCRCIVCLT